MPCQTTFARTAFAGIGRVLLMPTATPEPDARIAEMEIVAKAVADAGVCHVVYPSTAEAAGLDNRLLTAHQRVFAAIQGTGVQAHTSATACRRG